MNSDPGKNVFVFEVQEDGAVRRFVGHAPTLDADGLQLVWAALVSQAQLDPRKVLRLYSEWGLSKDDAAFAQRTFPVAEVSFSFARPAEGDWDRAMEEASKSMASAMRKASKKWWQFWK